MRKLNFGGGQLAVRGYLGELHDVASFREFTERPTRRLCIFGRVARFFGLLASEPCDFEVLARVAGTPEARGCKARDLRLCKRVPGGLEAFDEARQARVFACKVCFKALPNSVASIAEAFDISALLMSSIVHPASRASSGV